MSRKLQENQRKYVQKEIKNKNKNKSKKTKKAKQIKIEDRAWIWLKNNKKIQKV